MPIAGKTYYMPHQAVIKNDHAKTRLRIVYDASSKIKDPALNDYKWQCLQVANSRFTSLLGTLWRSRSHVIVIAVADIEKAFLIIGIYMDDRNALRF